MDAPQCYGHPANLNRQWIMPCKDPAIGQRHPRPGIKPERLQTLRFFGNER